MRSAQNRDRLFNILRVLIGAGAALLISCLILVFTSDAPGESIRTFLCAPFADGYAIGQILTAAEPLLFTGVAVCIMVRCGQFNMFVEGAFFAGALTGAVLSACLTLGPVLTPLCAITAGALVAGLIGYVPAKLKSALGVNEFVTSLMCNFIVFWVCMYLLNNVFADPDYSSLATRMMPDESRLPLLSEDDQISSAIILAFVTAFLAWVFLMYTKWGYRIRMTGDNPSFARACGINTRRTVTSSQVIGAAIAGAGGAVFMIGNFYRFFWKALPNYGFDGFIVAILASSNPLLVPVASLFVGYLRVGAMEMSRLSDVPNEVIYVIQSLMMILVGAKTLLQSLRHRSLRRSSLSENAKKEVESNA